nr:Chain A, Insulin [unidentified]
LVEALYL